ncbi:MAG: AAA family ATPase [Desulfobacterales bacterium]|nr:AAA family ATPase [Desulfobacterales bacterium]MBF0395259.1 AAA family ATPase [Desulfobacterales bacterium]
MIKFAYGVSDFHSIISENYFYVDRTQYINNIEEMGKSLLFLRPRRFGKSLWLNTLANYYDVAKEKDFEKLFGHLAIGKNPTPLHNKYFILEWDFSCFRTYGTLKEIERSVLESINSSINRFNIKYSYLLPKQINISESINISSFEELVAIVGQTQYRLYLLIDEYDNFTNEVLASQGHKRYEELVGSDSLLKYIFREVKSATRGMGLDRVFATGVTPVVMSDITSGANIFTNISLELEFTKLCGFTETEVTEVLSSICEKCQVYEQGFNEALNLIRTWYNGYKFHLEQEDKIYNPTLCLYFLRSFQKYCKYPTPILDTNLSPDEDKLEYIQSIPGGEQLLLDLIQGDVQVSVSQLSDKFGLKVMHSQSAKDRIFLASFLWYSGVLSIIKQNEEGKIVLNIPNLVIHRLYIERIKNNLLPSPLSRDDALDAAEKLCNKGEMGDLCFFIEKSIFPIFSNRDLRHANELTIKTLFIALLFNDNFYLMMSEREHHKGYPDLAMVVRPDCRKFKILDIVIEFKHISIKDLGMTAETLRQKDEKELRGLDIVKQKFSDAKIQALRYANDLSKELTILASNIFSS